MITDVSIYDYIQADIKLTQALVKDLVYSADLNKKDCEAVIKIFNKVKDKIVRDIDIYVDTVEVDSSNLKEALHNVSDDIDDDADPVFVSILPSFKKAEIEQALYDIDQALYFNKPLSQEKLNSLREFLADLRNNDSDQT